eukprot:11219416-Lingulodinium_polyedra.AAC.1
MPERRDGIRQSAMRPGSAVIPWRPCKVLSLAGTKDDADWRLGRLWSTAHRRDRSKECRGGQERMLEVIETHVNGSGHEPQDNASLCQRRGLAVDVGLIRVEINALDRADSFGDQERWQKSDR